MTPHKEKDNQIIIEMLDSLKEMPERNSLASSQGKDQFLAEARIIKETVSQNPFHRLNKWITTIPFIRLRKERTTMMKALASIGLALAILLGGAGVTAFAAQDSLPSDTLYPVKLFLEETSYTLATDPVTQVELLTAFSNNRVDEAIASAEKGEAVPAGIVIALQTNTQLMLGLAAGMDEEDTSTALEHVRTNIRTQPLIMTMLNQPENDNRTLEQLHAILQEVQRLAEIGSVDPLKFKQMFRHNWEEPVEDTASAAEDQTSIEPQRPQEPNADAAGNGPKYNWEDSGTEVNGNEAAGNEAPGNAAPGNAAPGNADPGTGDGNAEPGNAEPGNAEPGNAATGYGDPDPGDPDPGDPEPGDPDPGEGEKGNADPGNVDPGNVDPGKPKGSEETP